MDRFDRIFELHRILAGRRTPISRRELQERLRCSRATVGRLIEDARDFMGMPITYERERNGYRFDPEAEGKYELPGLWFNASELYALLAAQKLLNEVQPGLLEPHLAPLRERINAILHHRRAGHPRVDERIRILQMAARTTRLEHFQLVVTALLNRRQLRILYRSRSRDEISEREVSPQRLVYYRDNWYLDAWCHLRSGLRSFSLDRMEARVVLNTPARNIADRELDAHYADAYGIFGGAADRTALLRFSKNMAKWVADEHWHPHQEGTVLPNGEYELKVPYGNPTELIMDILKYGEEVEVLAPAELRSAVAARLRAAAARYAGADAAARRTGKDVA